MSHKDGRVVSNECEGSIEQGVQVVKETPYEAAEKEKGTKPWHWSHILAASLNMVWEQLVRKRTVWPDAFKAAKKKFEKKELNHRLRNGTVLWDSKKNGTYDLKRIVARFYDRVGGLEPEEGERVLREVLGADITEAVNSDHD